MKKKWLFVAVGTVAFVFIVFALRYGIYSKDPNDIVIIDSLGTQLNKNVNEIDQSMIIEQKFLAIEDNLHAIDIFFSTFNRKNAGKTKVEIIDLGTDEIIRDIELLNSQIIDNSYNRINFSPIEGTKGHGLALRISSENTDKDNAITVWVDDNTKKDSELMINELEWDGSLVIKMNYSKKFEMKSFFISTIMFLIINTVLLKMIMFLKR